MNKVSAAKMGFAKPISLPCNHITKLYCIRDQILQRPSNSLQQHFIRQLFNLHRLSFYRLHRLHMRNQFHAYNAPSSVLPLMEEEEEGVLSMALVHSPKECYLVHFINDCPFLTKMAVPSNFHHFQNLRHVVFFAMID